MKKIGRLEKPDNQGTAKMFDHPFLERLTKTHISIPIVLFLSVGIYSIYQGSFYTEITTFTAIALFLSGYLAFTWVEYMMHRYFYHMVPDNKWKDKIQYTVHGVHHDYPKDTKRLAMPPFISALYAVILYLLFNLLMGIYSYFFLPGFLIGYALYLGIHYVVHAYQPPKNFMKLLWINHAIHHYKDPDAAFGVSTPLWDYLLGTMPGK